MVRFYYEGGYMSIYDLSVKKSDGSNLSLNDLRGKVMLIFNSATGCGLLHNMKE